MVPDRPLRADQQDLFKHMLLQISTENCLLYGLFYVVAAYWRAVKLNVINL